MKRDRLFRRIEQEWDGFLTSFEGLSDQAILEPGAVGEWSVRDVMAHAATWEEEALKALPLVLEGKPTPRYARYGGIDAFNACTQENKRHLSLGQVRDDLVATHRRLIEFLSGTPESAYAREGRFLHRLRLDTYGHYREHARQIEAWRKGGRR